MDCIPKSIVSLRIASTPQKRAGILYNDIYEWFKEVLYAQNIHSEPANAQLTAFCAFWPAFLAFFGGTIGQSDLSCFPQPSTRTIQNEVAGGIDI